MTIYAYIRVSSNIQMLEHQEFEIKKFVKTQNIKIDNWIEEKISSRKPLDKRKLGELLQGLKDGDILKCVVPCGDNQWANVNKCILSSANGV